MQGGYSMSNAVINLWDRISIYCMNHDEPKPMEIIKNSELIKTPFYACENYVKDPADAGAEILMVSQFTLYWNCKKGTRPSFDGAMPPAEANEMYNKFVDYAKTTGIKVETGIFGADMKVSLINDGPVTVTLDTSN